MTRIRVGWQLTKKSWAVLRNDKSLMWFPILAAITSALALVFLIGLAVGLDLSGAVDFVHQKDADKGGGSDFSAAAGIVLLVVLSYVSVWFSIFFNAALASCAVRSMQGEDTTVGEGIRAAWARKGQISAWAFVVCTVGMILRSLEERLGFLGAIVAGILGLAWGLITLFAVPVIVLEEGGPWSTLKRSAQIFKERWGESLTGRAAIGVISGLIALLAILIGLPLIVLVGMKVSVALAVVLAVVLFLALICASVVLSALTQTFNVAMYAYSVSGAQLGEFSEDDFRRAFKMKS